MDADLEQFITLVRSLETERNRLQVELVETNRWTKERIDALEEENRQLKVDIVAIEAENKRNMDCGLAYLKAEMRANALEADNDKLESDLADLEEEVDEWREWGRPSLVYIHDRPRRWDYGCNPIPEDPEAK